MVTEETVNMRLATPEQISNVRNLACQSRTANMLITAGALEACAQSADRANTLLARLINLVEAASIAPESNCSCHVCPPCNDCVEWGELREALADARMSITNTEVRS